MRAADLRDMGEAALRDHIATTRRDLFGLRMQHATGELDNTARLRPTTTSSGSRGSQGFRGFRQPSVVS